jgi:hypothetical protein
MLTWQDFLHTPYPTMRLRVADFIAYKFERLVCRIRGHRWEVCVVYPEDGGEEIQCTRCGESRTHFF